MTVAQVGTAVTASNTASLTPSVTGTWGTGQTRAAGDLLVAVVTGYGNNTAFLGDSPAGWMLFDMSHGALASGTDIAAVYFRTAAGTDAAPVFTATMTGTAADCRLDVTLYQHNDSAGGTPVLSTSGAAAGTSGTTLTVTTRLNVITGSAALAVIIVSQGTTAATASWSPPAGWTAEPNIAASFRAQFAIWSLASPAAGSALSAALPHGRTTTLMAGLILVISPHGSAQPVYTDSLASKSQASVTAATGVTWTHVSNGTGALVVGVSCGDPSVTGSSAISTITCDGTTLAAITAAEIPGSTPDNGGFARQYGLAGVTAGSHTIIVKPNQTVDLELSSRVIAGADPVAPFGTGTVAQGTGATASITKTGTAGNLILYATCSGTAIGGGPNGTAYRTYGKSLNGNSGGGAGDHGAAVATGSSQAISSLIGSDDWAVTAVEILPATSSGTSVPLAEAGGGADALGVASDAGSPQESGAGADSLTIAAAVGLAEAGAAADTLGITVTLGIALAEAGAGADTLGLGAAVALAEAGAAADSLAVTSVSTVALAESGSGTDALGTAAAVALSEAGAGADALSLAVPQALAEAGAGTDTLAVTAASPVPLAEAGAAADALAVVSGTALAESGAGTDSVALSAAVALAEAGAGAASLGIMPGLSEAGAGADTLAVTVTSPVALSEAGAGSDALAVTAAAAVALSEAGSGTDALGAAVGLSLAEAGHGADALGITVAVALSEAGTGTEALRLALPVALAEAGAGADVLALATTVTVALSESGAGADTLVAGGIVLITDSDSCTASESEWAFPDDADGAVMSDGGEVITIRDRDSARMSEAELTAWPSDQDSCRADDEAMSAWPADREDCTGFDGGERIIFSDSAESCAAADAVFALQVWTYPPLLSIGPGGSFEVRAAGRVVITGRHAGADVLRFARGLAGAAEVTWVRDSDAATMTEAERVPDSVTIEILPALDVSVLVSGA